MELELSHTIQNNILIITLEFDKLYALNAPTFKNKVLELLQQAHIFKVIFDLDHIQFMDSSGLGAFFVIQREAKKQGGSVRLVNFHTNIQALFEIISIHQILSIFPSRE